MRVSLLTCAFLLLAGIFSLQAQSVVSVDLQRNSTLIIHGSTNIIPFKLEQNGDKLVRRNLSVTYSKNQNKITINQAALMVVVKNFTSDNKMAQRDFQKLVKADVYPTMQIVVQSLDLAAGADASANFSGIANLNVTITGITRPYTIPVTLNSEGDLYNVDGKKRLNIRDFGLTPPVQMMGLVRVSEWIDIDFHLICKIRQEVSAKL